MARVKQVLKKIFLFDTPEKNYKFSLEDFKRTNDFKEKSNENYSNRTRDFSNDMKTHLAFKNLIPDDMVDLNTAPEVIPENFQIKLNIKENFEYLKQIYTVSKNKDIQVREFDINISGRICSAFIIFIDGMVNSKFINDNIITPLMLLANLEINNKQDNIADYIEKHLISHNQLKKTINMREVIDSINIGECAIFIDASQIAFLADVKGWDDRGVERPNSEMVIRGPQEGFTEKIRTNTALVRKIINNENLIIENIKVGEKSRTQCCVCYIKDITNENLIEEVKRRIENVKIDYLIASGELEQLIEDNPYLPFPQILSTERPDRFSRLLTEGKVGVLVNGSPFALVMPITHDELVHSAEDDYVRFPSANLLRFTRMLGIAVSLFLPGIYLAIINFHQEIIPTDLLIALESTREKIPFTSLVEILLMEVSFELIREASIRIPEPVGSTLGIVGGLILGQAAVSANIVSPILIIIVAVTGIGSFAVPNFSLAFSFRILRFLYIFLGSIAGIVGIFIGIFVHMAILCNTKSFGVPYMSSSVGETKISIFDEFFRVPFWMLGGKPQHLKTKYKNKANSIARKWEKNNQRL